MFRGSFFELPQFACRASPCRNRQFRPSPPKARRTSAAWAARLAATAQTPAGHPRLRASLAKLGHSCHGYLTEGRSMLKLYAEYRANYRASINAFHVAIVNLNRCPLLQKFNRHQQSLPAMPFDYRAFHARQRTAQHTNPLSRLQSRFRNERHFGVNELSNLSQVVPQPIAVVHLQAARHAVRRQCRPALIFIAVQKHVTGKQRQVGGANPPGGRSFAKLDQRCIKRNLRREQPAHQLFLAPRHRVQGPPTAPVSIALDAIEQVARKTSRADE